MAQVVKTTPKSVCCRSYQWQEEAASPVVILWRTGGGWIFWNFTQYGEFCNGESEAGRVLWPQEKCTKYTHLVKPNRILMNRRMSIILLCASWHLHVSLVTTEIKSEIILSCSSQRLRRKALRDTTMTLAESLLDEARGLEISEKQAKDIETSGSANAVLSRPPETPQEKMCFNCGEGWPHDSKARHHK